ncbi:efflux RND transporter periplasmic adaptor subunit [Ralstonia syzygii subsp. celebesensis]|uniref:Efflux transporter periplasmic adaptor subunit n=2 Tax=Ralstonia syzygii subsp. celebesensis TaxID=1310168 RepID=A0A1U9VJX8_9RALS|nr:MULTISPECIES: efflux RND transporter periplasmic adaptor subunit [Ralstonia solanacearum species complex]AQW31022.1 efflux transporter periplasmic adaptor subunit [blood disease bacterium A2-HR MARDI]CBJ34740.1 RND efflux pump, membrane fusion protein, CzcB subfamily [Ralstonia solanacearum PSI07]CCA81705.1 RND efflux pump, membrane fusion protein, CzcB subfamily [blood disease bacterium R229]
MPENTLPTRRSAAVLTACAALIAVVAVVTAGLLSRRSQARDLQVRAAAQAVPAVKLVEPTALAAETLELPARLEPWARAPIHARVSGYLKRWSIDIGGSVKAGQVLGEIETPELDEQLAQARAELATARSNAALAASTARRWQSLLATDSVSRQEADEKAGDLAAKQSVVHALQANVDRVQATKQYARLLAPFDGVVTARNTDVGALIGAGGSPGNELFVVSDIRRLRVYVNVPQRQATAVRMGSEAQLIVPERPAQVYRARVESLAHAIQSGSGAMLVQLVVDNQAGELLPGGFATVRFPLSEQERRIGVPPGALIFGKDGVRVATVQGGDRVLLKPVTIARDLGSVVELEAGLGRADRVIDSPPDGLASGDRVRITSAPKKATS